MTNTQLYLAVGIPSFLVLLNTGVMVALFGNLSGRIEGLSARIDRLDVKLDSMKSEVIVRIDRVADRLHEIQLTLGRHDARLDALEGKRTA